MVKDSLRERVPDGGIDWMKTRKLLDTLPQLGSELLVSFRAAREPDDGERGWKLAFVREVVKRGHKLAMRQVARGAEDDDGARVGRVARDDSFAEWIGRQRVLFHRS